MTDPKDRPSARVLRSLGDQELQRAVIELESIGKRLDGEAEEIVSQLAEAGREELAERRPEQAGTLYNIRVVVLADSPEEALDRVREAAYPEPCNAYKVEMWS